MIHHLTRATRHLIFWSLLLAAGVLTAVRLMLIGVESYKANLEVKISAALGSPVRLGGLGANMRGVTPELVLKSIDVIPAIATEEPPIHIKEIRWGINLGQYLINRALLPSSVVTLVGAEFSLYRDKNGRFGITGLKPGSGQPSWLFRGHYNLLDSRINWQDLREGNKPLLFESLNAAVINEGDHHRINAFTDLPSMYGGGELKMAVDLRGNVEEPDSLAGLAYLEGRQVRLSGLVSSYLPMDIRLLSGTADFKLWAKGGSSGALSAMTGLVEFKDAVFAREGYGRLPVKSLKADFKSGMAPNNWRVDFNHFQLQTESTAERKARHWPDAIFSLGYQKASVPLSEQIKLYAQELELAETSQLLHFFGPAANSRLQNLKQFDPKGRVKNVSLYFEPGSNRYALSGEFQSMSFEPAGNTPGMANLSGNIKASDSAGVMAINARDVLFNDRRIFDKTLPFTKLKGLFNWRNGPDAWRLSSPLAGLDCSAFTSQTRLDLIFPKKEVAPLIDLQTSYASHDVSQIKNYLPVQIMKEKLKLWMGNAFLAGKAGDGELLFYGQPGRFPFKDNSGVFEAALNLNNIQLKYHPDWPQIGGIDGRLTFDKDVIEGKFERGSIGKAKINPTTMTISGLADKPQLLINGESEGEAEEMLKVLQQSPLSGRVVPLLKHAKITGNGKAALNLTVPFYQGEPVKADVSATLANVQISPNGLNLPLSQINGELKFNGEGATAEAISAVFFGRPVNIGVNSANQKTAITIHGKISVDDLEKMGKIPEKFQAEGETNYSLELLAPEAQADGSTIQVNLRTDLDGVKLTLPGGLSKIKMQKKPLVLALKLSEKSSVLPLQLNYNNELKAALNYALKEKSIASGHVLIGPGTVNLPFNPGLKLEINRTPLALEDWLSYYSKADLSPNAGLIQEIKLHSSSAFWNQTRIGAFDLSLKRNPSFWSGEIDTLFAKGVFDIPFDFNSFKPAVMAMEMVNLSLLKQLSGQADTAASDIKVAPTVRSNKTLWRSEDLGRLSLETEPIAMGLKIKNLSIEGPDETLSATGTWEKASSASVTQLQGKLMMNRADLLLSKLNITKDFTETRGNVNFQLIWNAPPLQLTLPKLRGHMDVNLKNGRILSIEPGFGRVLGILAVEQWVKRLQLDFRDIFAEGLTFNSIKGDFQLLKGKATTKNLLIDAVPARINIAGSTDLVEQTVDHLIKVVPKSSDAVPIAGTIVGKVATLIGKTLTGKDQDGLFFGRQYMVKGGWNNASIIPLRENDGILQKTWDNITDFPWVE